MTRVATRPGRPRSKRFIVLTGLSGAGKSQAIRALEDLGYFCVDNLPVALLPFMAEFAQQHATEHDRIAVVMDVREPRFTTDFPAMYRSLRKVHDPAPTLIFLEAGQAELVRRFSETRRPHPLAPDRPVTEGLAEERASLRPIKAMADKVVDTTSMNVHELRQVFLNVVAGRRQASTLVLTFLSFGFHYGVPAEADLVFDVRFLKNPHWVPALRPQTGRDRAVASYMRRQPLTGRFLRRIEGFLRFVLPHYVDEGKAYLTVAIGCTGGRHRSVFVAESLKRNLANVKGLATKVRHRDMGRQA
ncbi:MAG TPA: RNase adapter RapZ [Vicinamibacterales bacterium]|nr:RNase adapter RapZ [Vicinamibacterales bacterium]